MNHLVSTFLENWSSFYANHGFIRTVVDFLHIGGLMIAGGFALTADRAILKAAIRPEARKLQLETLRRSHKPVLIGLIAVTSSGFLLFAADSDNFLHSMYFWIKIGLFGTLLINGAVLARAERIANRGESKGWRQLQWTSSLSIVLWLLTTLAGTALPNVG
jgi:hypothetical protein